MIERDALSQAIAGALAECDPVARVEQTWDGMLAIVPSAENDAGFDILLRSSNLSGFPKDLNQREEWILELIGFAVETTGCPTGLALPAVTEID